MTAPRLETERLILREYTLADFPAHAAMWADPRTTRLFNTPAHAFDKEMCWLRFLRNFGQWQLFGHGFWGIQDKASEGYIGAVGFFHAKREIGLDYCGMPEAGWVIAPDFQGCGLGTEALKAAIAWADAHIEAPESWCMIAPQNLISQKTAARAGYRPAADAHYKGEPVLTFRRSRGGACM